MHSFSKIYFESPDVHQRLLELGLGVNDFRTAALKGFSAWAECTPNHPPTYAGTAFWAETTRALGEALFYSGWTRKNESNLPLVVNEEKTIAIAVSSGDEQTGSAEYSPTTRSAKGPKTADAVRVNARQLTFDFIEQMPVVDSPKIAGRNTWLFLTFRDLACKEIRMELSRPISMAPDGHVDRWAERIILPAQPFGGEPELGSDWLDGDDGQSPHIIVEIRKRG
jgi:hypothetical protein